VNVLSLAKDWVPVPTSPELVVVASPNPTAAPAEVLRTRHLHVPALLVQLSPAPPYVALGFVREQEEILNNMILYIQRYKDNNKEELPIEY
jgi:hypothetical protein